MLPFRMHRVHTRIRFGVLPTTTLTRWRLGFHLRLVRLWAWLTRCPNIGPFPQISHRFAMNGDSPVWRHSATDLKWSIACAKP